MVAGAAEYTNQRPLADSADAPALLIKLAPAKVISPPVVLTALVSVTLPSACAVKLPVSVDVVKAILLASTSDTFLAPVMLTEPKSLAALVAVTSPAPAILMAFAAEYTAPLIVNNEAAEVVPILLAAAVITLPVTVAAPVPVSAPTPPTPLPLMVIASAAKVTLSTFKVAPLVTVVPAPVAPNALILAADSVPACTCVKPV